MKPEFICIGAQKAGTTWLFSRLKSHPEFSMLPIKELHYFDRSRKYPSPNDLSETQLGKRLLETGYAAEATRQILRCLGSRDFRRARWWSRYYFSSYSDAWYRSLFAFETGITGDITPSYSILNERDVARMHATAPDARILFLMRNPIERTWSMYRFGEKAGSAIELNDIGAFVRFVDSPAQELRSDYLRTIDLFLKYYDSRQMLLGYYDAIIDQPEALLSAILKHFGANDTESVTGLRVKNNRSRSVELPDAYRDYLESKYRKDLEELARRFGGYATRWLASLSGDGAEQPDGTDHPLPVTHP